MVFFDTSVVIAATLAEHPAHERCASKLTSLKSGAGCIGVNSLAEIYRVLSGYPRRPRILPMQALEAIMALQSRLNVIDLTSGDYLKVIRTQAEFGNSGGKIYDALLVECARKARATALFTLNVKDFVAVAPDLAGRIAEP